ncbi:ANK_REP_REGION domain-containing protein [Trichonephila inaurata madagascariensis]|uniref:Alpha-latrotoxin n=1 Tax=Trichonephila inaurata madagascariensis TaxID=2747483 RepID=A0A8X6YWF3_9ARAC|nr:ANK_REP_REGION domain-containing protein [Trichonephila inaurata madagascariensis]
MLAQKRCIPQILYDKFSGNYVKYLDTSEITQSSHVDVISREVAEGNHTTTINVYKLNYDALMLLVFFSVIIVIIIYSWKGRRIRTLTPPAPVIYYLAKCACLSGNASLIAFMIRKGADVNRVSICGDSGLYLAVYGLDSRTSNFQNLDILLAAGCDINCQNNNGFTALHLASMKGNVLLVQYLLRNGADLTITTSEMMLPYEMALSEGHEEIAKYLKNKTKHIE